MDGRRWLAVSLIAIGVIPALLAAAVLWFAIHHPPDGCMGPTRIGIPTAGSPLRVDLWILTLVAAVSAAGICFTGGCVLWHGDGRES